MNVDVLDINFQRTRAQLNKEGVSGKPKNFNLPQRGKVGLNVKIVV